MEIAVKTTNEAPVRPSERLGEPIPQGLDDLVLDCLAKDPAERPASAREMISRLDAVRDSGAWTEDDARRWWEENAERL
jgi:serine/threonine-protein kinase